MSAHAVAHRQPVWAAQRRRVPGAPADLTLHVLHLEDVSSWAFSAVDCLTEDELSRACALQDSHTRELFVVSRVALRHVLAHRLGCAAHEVPISHDPRTGAPHEVHGRAAAVIEWKTGAWLRASSEADQATAGRTMGRSRTGRLISAPNTPNRIAIHHIRS